MFKLFSLTTCSLLVLTSNFSIAASKQNQTTDTCTEAVIVIRHAEDTRDGPHALTTAGERHASLYTMFFQKGIFNDYKRLRGDQINLCPIKRIITVDKTHTPNPLSTIAPFAEASGITKIETNFGNGWHTDDRKKLLDQNIEQSLNKSSTLISWTRQGLWGDDQKNISKKALLSKLTANDEGRYKIINGKSPMHDNVYIFSNQDKESGKFNEVHLYHQMYNFDKTKDNFICYHRLSPNWGYDKIFEPIKMERLSYDECKWGD